MISKKDTSVTLLMQKGTSGAPCASLRPGTIAAGTPLTVLKNVRSLIGTLGISNHASA